MGTLPAGSISTKKVAKAVTARSQGMATGED
jgi:hypothetical protein